MTAQVFRNGQQPTFYVSDVLIPVPGGTGVDGVFQTVTVRDHLLVDANTATSSYPPMRLQSSGALSSAIELSIQDNVSGRAGSFGLNTAEVAPSLYAFASTGTDLKFGAGGTERLRLKSAGIASSTTTTSALALATGSTTMFAFPLESGTFLTTWTSIGGVSVDPVPLIMHYTKAGNQVTCSFIGLNATLTGGAVTARVTVPFPSTAITSNAIAAAGAGTFQATGEGFSIFGNSGLSTDVTFQAGASTATVGTAVTGTFIYTLT